MPALPLRVGRALPAALGANCLLIETQADSVSTRATQGWFHTFAFDPTRSGGPAMRLQGAVVNELGVTFSIVVVKEYATQTSASAERARVSVQHLFPGMPIILASRNSSGRFKYQGRLDIVRFLSRTDPSRIPWKEYALS